MTRKMYTNVHAPKVCLASWRASRCPVLFHIHVKSSAPASIPRATFPSGTDMSFLGREWWGPFHSPATHQQRGDSKSRSPSGEQDLTALGRHVERRCTSLGKHQSSFTSASDQQGAGQCDTWVSCQHSHPSEQAAEEGWAWKGMSTLPWSSQKPAPELVGVGKTVRKEDGRRDWS